MGPLRAEEPSVSVLELWDSQFCGPALRRGPRSLLCGPPFRFPGQRRENTHTHPHTGTEQAWVQKPGPPCGEL